MDKMIKLQAEKYCQITGEKCIGHEACASCPVQENTQFTCTRCGERWNLLSDPNAETDICPVCGITVKSDSERIDAVEMVKEVRQAKSTKILEMLDNDGSYDDTEYDPERGKYR